MSNERPKNPMAEETSKQLADALKRGADNHVALTKRDAERAAARKAGEQARKPSY